MNSGTVFLYGFKTSLQNVKNIFNIPIGLENPLDILEYCEEMTEDYDNFAVFGLPCHYFDKDSVFIGVILGTIKFDYKEKFENFEYIQNNMNKQIENLEFKFNDKQNEIDCEIDELFVEFPSIQQYLHKSSLSFYTIPNCCESCDCDY